MGLGLGGAQPKRSFPEVSWLPSVGKAVKAGEGIQEGTRPSPETIGEEGLGPCPYLGVESGSSAGAVVVGEV